MPQKAKSPPKCAVKNKESTPKSNLKRKTRSWTLPNQSDLTGGNDPPIANGYKRVGLSPSPRKTLTPLIHLLFLQACVELHSLIFFYPPPFSPFCIPLSRDCLCRVKNYVSYFTKGEKKKNYVRSRGPDKMAYLFKKGSYLWIMFTF